MHQEHDKFQAHSRNWKLIFTNNEEERHKGLETINACLHGWQACSPFWLWGWLQSYMLTSKPITLYTLLMCDPTARQFCFNKLSGEECRHLLALWRHYHLLVQLLSSQNALRAAMWALGLYVPSSVTPIMANFQWGFKINCSLIFTSFQCGGAWQSDE